MKKLFFVFIALFSFIQVQAADAYITLDRQPSAKQNVIEFFSFYCPHCYTFEYEYQIPSKIRAALPKDVDFKQYHLGSQDDLLTQAWALAMLLGVENKVRQPIFDTIQARLKQANKFIPLSKKDFRRIFLNAGVTEEQFNAFDSFAVTALTKKQQKLAEELNVNSVPVFFVDEKYQIDPKKLPNKNLESFINGYVKTISDLLQKH